MSKLQRKYLLQFIISFLGLTVAMAVVFSMVSVVEEIDELLRYNLSIYEIIQIALLKIPKFTAYLLPLSAMTGVFIVITVATKRNEITAIRAAGVNIKEFLLPFVITSLVLAVLHFMISEVITPASNNRISNLIQHSRKTYSYYSGELWIRPRKGLIARAAAFDPYKGVIKGISIFWIKNGLLYKRAEAPQGQWKDKDWLLLSPTVYDLSKKKLFNLTSLTIKDIGSAGEFTELKKKIEEMSVFALKKYLKRLDSFGIKNKKLWVDLYSRFFYPLTVPVMVVIALFIGIHIRTIGGALAVVTVILTIAGYWFVYTMALSLGYAGTLPPFLAGCIVPVVFASLALYLYFRLPT